jgi:hypothetical protein
MPVVAAGAREARSKKQIQEAKPTSKQQQETPRAAATTERSS